VCSARIRGLLLVVQFGVGDCSWLTWQYTRKENSNIALTAEVDLSKSEGNFVLALGFGNHPKEAARNAVASLHDGFEKAKNDYVALLGDVTRAA
jgi:GH15 family glucan-1,4-alpha-glucosidase